MHTHFSNMFQCHPHAQIKSYARVHGQTEENDKGYVSFSYNRKVAGCYKGSNNKAHLYRLSLLLSFVFLNVLTPVVLARLVFLHYQNMESKISNGNFMKYLYWTASCTAFLINIGYTIASLKHQYTSNQPSITSCVIQLPNHKCSIPSDASVYNDEVLTLVAKFTIVPVAVIMEFLISVYVVKNNDNIRQEKVGFRCSSLKHYLLLSAHTVALWNILTTLQLSSMIVIPLCVLLLIHPQVTITFVITLLLLPVGFTLAVAYMLNQCQKPRSRNFQSSAKCCGSTCLHSVVITATIGLILSLLVLYEVMLLVQVQIETGVKGIVLLLLPSFPLSALGWYLKKRSQKRSMKDPEEEQLISEEYLIPQTDNSNCDLILL